jgi:hypothetical protein
MRSRVSITISIGPIRFFRSASRNSATVFASTPARRAPRDAVPAVVFAAFCAFCWRPRACPPFLAAALRFADDEERELDDEPELVERLREPDERLLLAEARLFELPEERLPDERLLDERLDPPDFRALPPELPLLRRSAMLLLPLWFPATLWSRITPERRTISLRSE